MLKILGRPNSINVRKVLWTCVELQLPYELEPWGAGVRDTQTPEFLALNPNAMVPVIVDEGFVLWESNTICRYLATRHQAVGLLPAEAQARAQVEQWMDWQATELNTAWRYPFMSLVRKSPAYQDTALLAEGIAAWGWQMKILETQLQQTQAYVAGEHFTLADVVIGLSVQRWFMTPIERPALPAVAAYYDRLNAREGFRQHGRNGMP
jgi:glutathione S-transferase